MENTELIKELIVNSVYDGLKEWTGYILILYVIVIIMTTLLNYVIERFNIGFDDTDNDIEHKRSLMKVYTDHKTGLQYLATANGGLTPRLDKNGKQINIKEK